MKDLSLRGIELLFIQVLTQLAMELLLFLLLPASSPSDVI